MSVNRLRSLGCVVNGGVGWVAHTGAWHTYAHVVSDKSRKVRVEATTGGKGESDSGQTRDCGFDF